MSRTNRDSRIDTIVGNFGLTGPRLTWHGWVTLVVNGSVIVAVRGGFTRRQSAIRAARKLVELAHAEQSRAAVRLDVPKETQQ